MHVYMWVHMHVWAEIREGCLEASVTLCFTPLRQRLSLNLTFLARLIASTSDSPGSSLSMLGLQAWVKPCPDCHMAARVPALGLRLGQQIFYVLSYYV